MVARCGCGVLPAALSETVRRRQVGDVNAHHRFAQATGDLGDHRDVLPVLGCLHHCGSTCFRIAGLEDAGAHEYTISTELHHESGICRGGYTTGDQQRHRQSTSFSDLRNQVVGRLQFLRRNVELIAVIRPDRLKSCDLTGDLADVLGCLGDITRAGLALGADHRRTLIDATQGLTKIGCATDKRDPKGTFVDVIDVISWAEHLRFVNVVHTQVLQNLRFHGVANPGLRHDRNVNSIQDSLDQIRIGHAGHATLRADICWDALERHHSRCACIFSNLRLLRRDHIHNHAADEFLVQFLCIRHTAQSARTTGRFQVPVLFRFFGPVALLIDVTRSLPIPLPAQVAASLRSAISSGALRPGEEVPSTRVLARQAGVSRGTVVSAYDQLISEGYLTATQGAPTRVNPSLPTDSADSSTSLPSDQTVGPQPLAREARPGQRGTRMMSLKPSSGHAGAIRPAAWRQAWREAAADPNVVNEATGQRPLREAIAEHLRTGRGVTVDPFDVIVTGGTREGLALALMTLSNGRRLRVGVEDPGHPGLRNIIPLTGHTMVLCPVDESGVSVTELPDDLDALLVTPSYQYPLGASMPAERRAALLKWATASNTVIIEDDFNAELRYRTAPLPPLAGLDKNAQVITLGTFSTLLNRSVAAGYITTSSALVADLRATRRTLGMPVAAVTQLAIAHLLRNGHVRRNTKAVHNRLAKRRETISATVIPQLIDRGARVTEMAESNGVDLAVTFPTPARRDAYAHALAEKGIEIGRLDALWSGRDDGLIISFAHLSEPDFERAIKVFVEDI